MTAYAVGHLRQVDLGPDIIAYLEGIDTTLKPFDGHFIIHGGVPEKLEGNWQGDLIVIAFPDLAAARAWYASAAYQAIVKLRTDHAVGDVFLVDGVSREHKAIEVLPEALRG
ncbi:DUF1330 domain-containing protein [Bosea sp. (in: a-proteobacteria)]|uniref:DUF1330 domain-containing protein n=1 Tax=Bosea sp. (in: a-proteobacteria) TaxID=1871050 RepID=UPI002FC59BF0